MNAKGTDWTMPLRIISVLFGLFLLLVPRREIAAWPLLKIWLYYIAVVGYIFFSSIRFRRVAQTLWMTMLLFGIAIIPIILTGFLLLGSAIKSDLSGLDAYAWGSLFLLLTLELFLPLALVLEFKRAHNIGRFEGSARKRRLKSAESRE